MELHFVSKSAHLLGRSKYLFLEKKSWAMQRFDIERII